MQKGYGVAQKVLMLGIDGMDPLYTKTLLAQGKLPNVKKFLEKGTTTKDMGMMGVLPAYTPPSWCTLATGAWPGAHGITDFWTHKSGQPLTKMTMGFKSELCKVDYIWDAFAKENKKTIVFGWPTSWPPRNNDNIMIDGTGIHPFLTQQVDYEKFIECREGDFPLEVISHLLNDTGADCFVTEDVAEKEFEFQKTTGIVTGDGDGEDANIGAEAYDKITASIKLAAGWANAPAGAKETVLPLNFGLDCRPVLIIADDGKTYNRIRVYKNKDQKELLIEVTAGQWSGTMIDVHEVGVFECRVAYRLKLVKLAKDGSSMTLYCSFGQNMEFEKNVCPQGIRDELFDRLGVPIMLSNMSHNDPEKLVIMTECAEMSFLWCMDAIDYLLDNKEWDGAFHGLHIIDAANHFFLDKTLEQFPEHKLYRELLERFYVLADEYVGRSLRWLDKGVSVFVVSDHGGLVKYPGYETPKIGDAWGLNIALMEELGYTRTKTVAGGKMAIDWDNTTAVAQRSSYIYVNLKGRDPQGCVKPENLDELVTKIISDLYAYRDPVHGERVISMAMRRDEMAVLGLHDASSECLGDIFFMLEPKFTRDQGNSFSNCQILGTSLKCLFMMAGAGIKENFIIPRNVQEVDMTPTLCHLAGIEMPNGSEGSVLHQGLK